MNGLAKKVIVYSLIGCLQLGVGATAAEAAVRHDDNRQRQEQRVRDQRAHEQRERERRQHEQERRMQEQREQERRQHEEERRMHEQRERERRHHEEMARHHHEDEHDDDNTLRDIGLGLILLTILANSGGDGN